MSRKRLPKYCLHKPSGQARVIIDGVHHWLGRYDSPESRAKYKRLVESHQRRQEWGEAASITVGQLAVLYLTHAESYYLKDGKRTSEVAVIRATLKVLLRGHRKIDVCLFTPKCLKAVRDEFVEAGCARSTCNKYTSVIVSMFRWGVSEEVVPVAVAAALREVPSLAQGRTNAVEAPPVGPASARGIEAVLKLVSPQLQGAIRFQLLTGARPTEALRLRPRDIDMSGPVWLYKPEAHKTVHHGKERVILIGPKCQELLRAYLPLGTDQYFFGLDDGARPYNVHSYRVAIRRACVRKDVEVWSPNQLRHNAATRIRKESRVDIAKTILGHSDLKTTEIYAERDLGQAMEVILRIG